MRISKFIAAVFAFALITTAASTQTTNPFNPNSVQTFTNKRITMRIGTTVTGATITPAGDSSDQYNVTALGGNTTFAIPSGTPTDGQVLVIRIRSDGTGGYTIAWTTSAGGYRIVGTTLPVTIVANKTIYVGCIYNAADAFWDVVAIDTQA